MFMKLTPVIIILSLKVYTCEANYTLSGVQDPLVKNGAMYLPCSLTADKSAWIQPTTWPSCVEVKPQW